MLKSIRRALTLSVSVFMVVASQIPCGDSKIDSSSFQDAHRRCYEISYQVMNPVQYEFPELPDPKAVCSRFGLDTCSYEQEEVVEEESKYKYSAEFVVTAYCACEICCGKWSQVNSKGGVVKGAAGVPLVSGVSVAIDRDQFSYGQEFFDEYGNRYVAADTGGAIKGYHIDIFTSSHEEARSYAKSTKVLYWN